MQERALPSLAFLCLSKATADLNLAVAGEVFLERILCYCQGTPPPWNRDFHSAHRNFSSERIDSRFLRAFYRRFIGKRKPTPRHPICQLRMGMTSCET